VAAFATIALAINANQKGSSVSAPTPVPNNSSLTTAKEEEITILKQKLTSDNVKEVSLLQELKNKHYLEKDETD
jgi:hypothetical protein